MWATKKTDQLPISRGLKPLTWNESARLILAFLFVYIAASDYNPLWMFEPRATPVRGESAPPSDFDHWSGDTQILAARKSGLSSSLERLTRFLEVKLRTLKATVKPATICQPDPKHLFPELRYNTPVEKIRLRPRAHAPPKVAASARAC